LIANVAKAIVDMLQRPTAAQKAPPIARRSACSAAPGADGSSATWDALGAGALSLRDRAGKPSVVIARTQACGLVPKQARDGKTRGLGYAASPHP
jgi:hypothetical protein